MVELQTVAVTSTEAQQHSLLQIEPSGLQSDQKEG